MGDGRDQLFTTEKVMEGHLWIFVFDKLGSIGEGFEVFQHMIIYL